MLGADSIAAGFPPFAPFEGWEPRTIPVSSLVTNNLTRERTEPNWDYARTLSQQIRHPCRSGKHYLAPPSRGIVGADSLGIWSASVSKAQNRSDFGNTGKRP